jgi:hypothetical protein
MNMSLEKIQNNLKAYKEQRAFYDSALDTIDSIVNRGVVGAREILSIPEIMGRLVLACREAESAVTTFEKWERELLAKEEKEKT